MTDVAQEPESRSSSGSPGAAASLPVAVVGSGRSSSFYGESLTLDSRFEVRLRSDELPTDADLSSLAAVFLFDAADRRLASVQRCLATGCRVVTDSPVAASAAASNELAALAASGDESSAVRILRRGFEDPDFRRAVEVVSDGEAGIVRHVEFTLQQTAAFFLPEDPDAPDPGCSPVSPELEFGVLTVFGPDVLARRGSRVSRHDLRRSTQASASGWSLKVASRLN